MSKKPKKKIGRVKQKREQAEYPHLTAKNNKKVIKDLIDFDYVDQLSEKEKAFLDKFSKEYYTADFRHEKHIHGAKQRKEIYRENNARNFNTHAIKRGTNKMDEIKDYLLVEENREDKLIELLDVTLNFKKSKKKT